MALVLLDRVQQTGTANTTVSFTLSGSVTGYQSFAVVGNGNTTYYGAIDASGNWEVGLGTYSTSGPTLTRTTILSSSSSNTAVSTFSGSVNIFVTYPAEDAVYLNASGNVSPLGTITSGAWSATTIAVASGGTGVTTSASNSANSVVLRDANVNITTNNTFNSYTAVTAAGLTTTMTAASSFYQKLVAGSGNQTFKLPDATTLPTGATYIFDNDSTGILIIQDNAGGAIDTIQPGSLDWIYLEANGTNAGSWGQYAFIPASYDFNTSTASFGNATITNATWSASTIGTSFGGTGLTTFSSSNYALYSTSPSTLVAGTLPVAAGGTGNITNTQNGVVYGNGTNALGVTAAGTTGQVLVGNTGAAPTWSNISSLAITSVSGTTNQITASTTTGAVTLSLPTSITTGQYIANQSISGSATQGAFAYGTLNGSDTGIFASYQTSIAGYAYMALQNTSSNAAATTDIALYNDTASLGKYIDIGINSSGFTGTGNFSLANAGYIYTNGGDLVLGTYSSNGIHFIINNGATDAMTINASNAIAFNGSYGTSGQILQSNGNAAAPTWTTFTGGATITPTTTNTAYFIVGTSATSGSLSIGSINTNVSFNPSTGVLSAPEIAATNGLYVNSATVNTSYSIPSGSNAMSVGPISVASGQSVTIASGQRWVIL